jgi:acyl carrier protein
MSELTTRVNNLSPNKQALLALRLDMQKEILTQTDEYSSKRLAAYVVNAEGQQPTNNQLQDFLRSKLPEYMMPGLFVRLDALPLSPNGKVDRKALRKPPESGPVARDNYVAPETDLEEELVRIWKEVLRVERVGTEDTFFELGGHSLLATQLISRIREAFLVELPLRSIFETPTIRGLALTIVQTQMEEVNNDELAELLSQMEGFTDDDEPPAQLPG